MCNMRAATTLQYKGKEKQNKTKTKNQRDLRQSYDNEQVREAKVKIAARESYVNKNVKSWPETTTVPKEAFFFFLNAKKIRWRV